MLTIYKASAGSGKTFTLALEFIKHLLGYRPEGADHYSFYATGRGTHHRDILAITFTNKATEEMKRRIVRELAVLAGAPLVAHRTSDYLDKLTETFNCTADRLREEANVALRGLLFDFNFFNVSTIDAFFQSILRVFAREAELTGNYDLELDDRMAIETGIADMLKSITHGRGRPRLEHWLERYMQSQFDAGNAFNIFNRTGALRRQLVRFVINLTGEDYKLHAKALNEYFEDPTRLERFEAALHRQVKTTIDNTADAVAALFRLIDGYGLPSTKFLNKNADALLQSWAAGTPKPMSDAMRALADGEMKKRYYVAWFNKGIPAEIDDAFVDVLRAIETASGRVAYMQLVSKQIFRLGMFADILRHVMEFRQDNNLILLSDTNDLLRRIIGEDDTPFIYERIGLWLRNFLIDEFQDTSRLQWGNLEPLVAQSLSEGNDSLIIGDEKQCIYRFRNSDPTLLQTQVQHTFAGRTREEGASEGANTNWRSSVDVIQFNNTLFATLAADLGFADLYANVRQAIPASHSNHRGFVRLTRFEGDSATFAANSLRFMASEICRQLASGYSQRDIAVLVRKRNNATAVIEYLLEEAAQEFPALAGLNVVSDEALLVGSAISVKVIVSVLRTIAHPMPNSERGYNISEGEFAAIVRTYNQTLAGGATTSEAMAVAVKEFHSRMETKTDEATETKPAVAGMSLTTLVESIIVDCLPEDMRNHEALYLTAFQDLVIDYSSRGTSDIHSFLTWWDARSNSEYLSTAPDIDGIRVMTIQKAKGLEFPCVHIPFANWQWVDMRDARWFPALGFDDMDAEIVPPMVAVEPNKVLANSPLAADYNRMRRESLVDELNATYVGFTRAVDELIINYDTAKLTADTCRLGALLDAAAMQMEDDNSHASDGSDNAVPVADMLTFGHPTVKTAVATAATVAPDEPTPYEIREYRVADNAGIWGKIRVADTSVPDYRRARGILLHDLLAHVRTAADISRAVRRFEAVGHLAGIATRQEAESLLQHALDTPQAAAWFDPHARRIVMERTIAKPTEGNYRPDRVVWTADGYVDVIDYKFGEEKPTQYGKQIRRYMQLLADMGHTPVRGFIWYVDSGRIVEVSD